jgi:predicted  nucleic acid-binding Zn-ribbon protein
MDEREGHETRLTEIGSELEVKRAAAADELSALDKEGADVERELAIARSERETLVEKVERDLLRMYNRICRARRFPALVSLHGSACGGCFGHLPPQVVRLVTHEGMLHLCENCGLLVYDSGGAVESAEGLAEPVDDR